MRAFTGFDQVSFATQSRWKTPSMLQSSSNSSKSEIIRAHCSYWMSPSSDPLSSESLRSWKPGNKRLNAAKKWFLNWFSSQSHARQFVPVHTPVTAHILSTLMANVINFLLAAISKQDCRFLPRHDSIPSHKKRKQDGFIFPTPQTDERRAIAFTCHPLTALSSRQLVFNYIDSMWLKWEWIKTSKFVASWGVTWTDHLEVCEGMLDEACQIQISLTGQLIRVFHERKLYKCCVGP